MDYQLTNEYGIGWTLKDLGKNTIVKNPDSIYGLSALSYPVLTFTERDLRLKESNPYMTDQERAAVVYFSMLADVPAPTVVGNYLAVDWVKAEEKAKGEPLFWLLQEGSRKYGDARLPQTSTSLQEAYVNSIWHLQRYLYMMNLWDGIEATLAEESRRRQATKAALDASGAAAAKALAYGRITQDEAATERDRIARENAELDRQLDLIRNGILPTGDNQGLEIPVQKSEGIGSLLPIAAAAAAAFFAFRS